MAKLNPVVTGGSGNGINGFDIDDDGLVGFYVAGVKVFEASAAGTGLAISAALTGAVNFQGSVTNLIATSSPTTGWFQVSGKAGFYVSGTKVLEFVSASEVDVNVALAALSTLSVT